MSDDSNTQEPTVAEPQAQGVEDAQHQQNAQHAQNGIEKRIGELTAKMYAAQEMAAKKDEHIMALTSKMTELMSKQQEMLTPVAPEPSLPEGMDPAQAAYFERLVSRIEAKYEAQLLQTQAQNQRGEAAAVANQLAARFGVRDAAIANQIAARAADLAAGWREKNLPFAPSDAADFAFMEHLKAGGLQQRPSSFSQPTQYAVTPGSGPVQNFAPTPPRQALPSNFDSLSPNQQLAELEKRGLDDLPL